MVVGDAEGDCGPSRLKRQGAVLHQSHIRSAPNLNRTAVTVPPGDREVRVTVQAEEESTGLRFDGRASVRGAAIVLVRSKYWNASDLIFFLFLFLFLFLFFFFFFFFFLFRHGGAVAQ